MTLVRLLAQPRLGMIGCLIAAWVAVTPRAVEAAPVVVSLAWAERTAVGAPGVAEPGETGRLEVSVTRLGDDPVLDLSGRLALVAPLVGVTLESELSSWPATAPGGTTPDAGGFVVSLDPSVPCGAEIEFELELREAGLPVATVGLVLRIGDADPVSIERTTASFQVAGEQVIVWNGSEYGVSWLVESGSSRVVWFRRLSADGSQLGDELLLPPSVGVRDGAPALSWGAGRWMIARYDPLGVRVAFIDADGTLLSQHHVVTWPNDRVATWRVTAAWDGVGWGLAFHSFDWQAGPERLLGITWVHVLPDGSVDAGPVTFDTAHEVRPTRQPIAWTGSAHALLAWGSSGSSLFLVDRSGALLAPARPLPLWGADPAMQWSGRNLGVAVSDGLSVRYVSLGPEGEILAGPTVVAAVETLDGGVEVSYTEPVSLAWDGTGFGISMLAADGSVAPGDSEFWGAFVRVSEQGEVRAPLQVITAPDPWLPLWSVGARAAFNPEAGEFAVLINGTDDLERASRSEGSIYLRRLRLDSECSSRPPPREVSAPGSGSPLRVTWVDEGRPWASLGLHFEDLGDEAVAYHAYRLGRTREGSLAAGEVWPPETLCMAVPGDHPGLTEDGPGRLRLRAFRWQVRDLDPGERVVNYVLVSAANETGEGITGRDVFGRERPPVNGCGQTP